MSTNSSLSNKKRNKAKRMFAEGRVRKEMDSERRTYFVVQGDTETHSVIFDKTRNAWSCSCKYNSNKNLECSHIFACKLSLK